MATLRAALLNGVDSVYSSPQQRDKNTLPASHSTWPICSASTWHCRERNDRSLSPRRGCQPTLVISVLSSALGAGIFALPYAVAHTGLLIAPCLLVLSATVAATSTWVLVTLTNAVGASSYGSLVQSILGTRAGKLADLTIAANGATCVPLLMIFQYDFIMGVLARYWPKPIARLQPQLGFRCGILFLICCWAFPLAIRRRYGALKRATFPFVAVIALTAGVIIAKAPHYHGTSAAAGDAAAALVTRNWKEGLKSLNIFLFVHLNHQNVPAICKDLPPGTCPLTLCILVAICEVLIYTSVGLAGYYSFGAATPQDFMTAYAPDDTLPSICRILLAGCLVFAMMPILLLSTASSFRRLTKATFVGAGSNFTGGAFQSDVAEQGSAGRSGWTALVERLMQWRRWQRRAVSLCVFMAFGVSVATLTDQVGVIISCVGGLIAITLLAVFPLLIVRKLSSNGSPLYKNQLSQKLSSLALVLASATALASCAATFLWRKN